MHDEKAYFEEQVERFTATLKHCTLISNLSGSRTVEPRRAWATWIFTRACITGMSIERLLSPHPSGYGNVSYLDHGSIASLSRCLIENIAVLMYVGDTTISEDEGIFRKHLIDLHDFVSRREFLGLLNPNEKEPAGLDDALIALQDRLRRNPFFSLLSPKRQKRLLKADDMFVDGRQAALNKIGWSENHVKALYKYLSMQSHTMPMSFHRSIMNRLYTNESDASKGLAAFAIEHARQAFGAGSIAMVSLFPDIEDRIDQTLLAHLRKEYAPE